MLVVQVGGTKRMKSWMRLMEPEPSEFAADYARRVLDLDVSWIYEHLEYSRDDFDLLLCYGMFLNILKI